MSHEARLAALGLTLPDPPSPIATYASAVLQDGMLYTAGHGPLRADGTFVVGKLGDTLQVEAGRDAARLTGLAMLATIRKVLGSLDRVERIVKVLGVVNATPDFTQHPQVINGFSDLFRDVFGEAGIAARSAIGTSSLPGGIPVEVEAIIKIAT